MVKIFLIKFNKSIDITVNQTNGNMPQYEVSYHDVQCNFCKLNGSDFWQWQRHQLRILMYRMVQNKRVARAARTYEQVRAVLLCKTTN